MLKNISCSLCASKDHKIILADNNYKILKCNDCSMVFLCPLPKSIDFQKMYSKTYFKQTDSPFGYADYRRMKKLLEEESIRRLEYMKRFTKLSGSLLDVGAGLGFFANQAKKRGFDVTVADISNYAVDYVWKTYKIKGLNCDLNYSLSVSEKFNVITAWDVFEHLIFPQKSFDLVNKALAVNGWLFLTTPNIDSFDARILKSAWYGFKKIPEHLQFFSPKTIRSFAEKANFRVVDIKTWGFIRDFDFVAKKLKLYTNFGGSLLEKVFGWVGIKHKKIYLPFIDMMVVLQKERNLS